MKKILNISAIIGRLIFITFVLLGLVDFSIQMITDERIKLIHIILDFFLTK